MTKIVFLTSFFDPWQAWNSLITDEFEKHNDAYEYFYVEESVIDTETLSKDVLYFVRSNSIQAQAICSYIFYGGGGIVNGVATTSYWPRIVLLNQLNKFGIPIPKSYCGFNLSSLYSSIPKDFYPAVQKSSTALAREPEMIKDGDQLLDRACKWSVDPKIPREPFYYEQFIDNARLIKIYVVGGDIFSFERFEGFGEKVVTKKPVPFALDEGIKKQLSSALQSCGLQIVSLDALFSDNPSAPWSVIDVNLVPMFHYLDDAPSLLHKFLIGLRGR
jgi:hypothetical protein